MQNASESFGLKMSKNTRPKLAGEVEFRQLALGAADNAALSATGNNSVSKPAEIVNDNTVLVDYATLETGRWLLNGKKKIMPDTVSERGQIGVWGGSLSKADRTFDSNLILVGSFSSPITTVGITLFFDTAQSEYAPTFTIRAYNGATLLKTANATSTGTYCVVEEPMDNYNRIEIEITSWSEADRFARISQIRFGIIRIFGDDETVEFSVLREVDPINMQTSAGELRFAFDNRDGKFDFENPTGIFNYIIDKQEVYARHGFTDEKVKLGKYYMAAWTSEDGKAIFRALDAISLTDIMFTDATYTSTSLMTIALAALSQSGITSYSLDNSLNDIIVTATIEEKTCRNILTWIATAACLTLYIDVDGALIIGALPSVANDYTISYLNSPKPKATLDDPLKSISVAYGTDLKVSASYAASGREITELDNPFIQTEARANAVLLWLYAYYSRRKNYQNDWRQDPRIEPGDIVKVQNDYGTPNVTVLSQQFTYSAGGLSGQTKSKGVN